MPDSRLAPQTVRYRERLWVPWWWWPAGLGLAGLLAYEVNLGVRSLPNWLPYVVLFAVAVGVLLWLSRLEIRSSSTTRTQETPASVITRSAEVPASAKSAALGRQLDPAAFVANRSWVGPLVLVVLDDPDDPTPYWLVSTRHPDRVISALRS